MTLTPTPDRQLSRLSALTVHWAAARMDAPVASPQGGTKATLPATGQPYTYARAVAGGSVTGSDGASVPAPPRDVAVWSAPDLDGDRSAPALRLTADDVFDIDIGFDLAAMGLYLDLVAGTDAVVWSVGDQVAPHLTLHSPSAGVYRVTHDNGTDAAVSVSTAVAPTAGVRVQLWGVLHADGSVSLWRRYDAGDWVAVGTSAAPASGVVATPGAATVTLGTDGTDDLYAAQVDLGPVYDQTTIEGTY